MFFGMLFVSSTYHRVLWTILSFGVLFVSSMSHKVIMDNFVFRYAFCVFNITESYHGQFCLSICFLCLQCLIE